METNIHYEKILEFGIKIDSIKKKKNFYLFLGQIFFFILKKWLNIYM
jgi:hypothetical protein